MAQQQRVRVPTKRIMGYYLDFDEARRERWLQLARKHFRKSDRHEVQGMGEIECGAASRDDLFYLAVNVTTVGQETCEFILREKMGMNVRRLILANSDGPEDAPARQAAHFLAQQARSIRISLADKDEVIAGQIHVHLRKVLAVEKIER